MCSVTAYTGYNYIAEKRFELSSAEREKQYAYTKES